MFNRFSNLSKNKPVQIRNTRGRSRDVSSDERSNAADSCISTEITWEEAVQCVMNPQVERVKLEPINEDAVVLQGLKEIGVSNGAVIFHDSQHSPMIEMQGRQANSQMLKPEGSLNGCWKLFSWSNALAGAPQEPADWARSLCITNASVRDGEGRPVRIVRRDDNKYLEGGLLLIDSTDILHRHGKSGSHLMYYRCRQCCAENGS